MRAMTFDANAILLSIVFSSAGFVCFMYGKRQGRIPQLVAGVTLMLYPYFVSNLVWMSAIGVAILGLMWLAVRLGA
jgi:hypothetical protein